jgi:hypothetical protein
MKEPIQIVIDERERQNKLWGEQNHPAPYWTGIIGEEFGELCEAITETYLIGKHPDRGGYKNLMKEASHIAATSIQFMEWLKRTYPDEVI